MWVGFPVPGAGAGWAPTAVSGWAASLPWAPLPGWFRLLDTLPEVWATIGALLVGAVAGTGRAHRGHGRSPSDHFPVPVGPGLTGGSID